MTREKKGLQVETITLEPVPASERRHWLSIAAIPAGSTICVPALMVGGMISANLSFVDSVIAMFVGYAISVGLMMLAAAQAAQTGVPSTVAISRALGTTGSRLTISVVIALSLIGWYGYQTIVCATSFCSLMSVMGFHFPEWIACILWGGLMLLTAFYGIKLLNILNYISVPILITFLIYGLYTVLSGGGIETISNYRPEVPGGMLTGITISVGSFISAAVTCGDVQRYSVDGKHAALSCVVGVIPFGVGALAIGAVLAICSGDTDITVMFAKIGLPVVGMLVLILATWTTNVNNAYSAGIAVVNAFKLKDDKRAMVTAICGILGILISLGGIVYYFVGFLSALSYLITPIGSLMVADYWIMGRGNAKDWGVFEGVNWLGIVAWICGALTIYFDTFFIPEIVGIIVTAVVYCVLCTVVKDPKYNPFAKKALE